MNILFIAAEVAPFATVGGLSQVMYFLPKSLKSAGNDVRVFSAKYGKIDEKNRDMNLWSFKTLMSGLKVPLGFSKDNQVQGEDKKDFLICNVKYFHGKQLDPSVYFLENREYYELRANVFGYSDDHTRFALLSKGCLEFFYQQSLKKSKDQWWPDVIHCNDWHTGYLVDWIRRDERYKKIFEKTAVVTTVHNFLYQGNYDFRYAPVKERDDIKTPLSPILSRNIQKQNPLQRSIVFSDGVSTVSPTHAIEILTPEFSYGLLPELENARGKLIGILNGLDTKEFNPAKDPLIRKKFTEKNFISAREVNKKDLQKSFSLPEDVEAPVIVSCGRLSSQKGWDLMFEILPKLLIEKPNLQFIALGSSDESNYREKLVNLQEVFPKQIGLHLRSDFMLPRKLYAGGDIILIPSSFEPGGIVALEALRYGCVPVVKRTGGLNDIVKDFDPNTKKGNGFSFISNDPWAFYASVIESLTIYKQQNLWKKLVENCINCDFSWDHAAREYHDWYERIIELRKRIVSKTPHPAYDPLIESS